MSNQYGSSLREFVARNVAEATFTVAPPADLAILATDWRRQLLYSANEGTQGGASANQMWSQQQNVKVSRIGVFSNFADGLVPKLGYHRLNVVMVTQAFTRAVGTITGTVTFTQNSRAIVGVGTGFVGQIPAGTVIEDIATGAVYIVSSVGDNLNAVLTDYARYTSAGTTVRIWAPAAAAQLVTYLGDIATLNTWYSCDKYLPIASLVTSATVDRIAHVVFCNRDARGNNLPMTFLTKSLDPAYVGDTAWFDVHVELECASGVL